jgi:hypothetical protein
MAATAESPDIPKDAPQGVLLRTIPVKITVPAPDPHACGPFASFAEFAAAHYDRQPSVSPDGQWVVLERDSHLYVYDRANGRCDKGLPLPPRAHTHLCGCEAALGRTPQRVVYGRGRVDGHARYAILPERAPGTGALPAHIAAGPGVDWVLAAAGPESRRLYVRARSEADGRLIDVIRVLNTDSWAVLGEFRQDPISLRNIDAMIVTKAGHLVVLTTLAVSRLAGVRSAVSVLSPEGRVLQEWRLPGRGMTYVVWTSMTYDPETDTIMVYNCDENRFYIYA